MTQDEIINEQQVFAGRLLQAIRKHGMDVESFVYESRPFVFWKTMSRLAGRSPENCQRYYKDNEGDLLHALIQSLPPDKPRRKK